jgi:hypothetical protein
MNQMNQNKKQMNQNMNQMNQNMNQKNKINKVKRKKEKKMSQNPSNLDQNQMDLLNSIIKFYKENDNEYMDFGNPNQIKNMINFLSLNYNKLDISDNIEDPLYYIEEPKKMIKFINSDYKEYKVNIPLSITKYDLYSIAQKYKCFKNNKKHLSGNHSNILLINNNLILKRDKTSIDCINENDIIIIIEPRSFPDDSFYNSLQERIKNCEAENKFPLQEIAKTKYLEILYSNPCGMYLTARMTTNYQQLKTIYQQRRHHRLPEWQEFCDWCETLPHFMELCFSVDNQ